VHPIRRQQSNRSFELTRPAYIAHWKDIEEQPAGSYPNSAELMSFGAPFARLFGLERIGIHHERLPPGRRTSYPHAEKTEEEFVYVLEGTPDVWIDGTLHRLKEGEGVVFKPGTGIAHTFINNTSAEVRLLVVGEHRRSDNQVHYPLHPQRNVELGADHWSNCPTALSGSHDGFPDALRDSNGPF
jgi:uncharacterized cupin superfamily protein